MRLGFFILLLTNLLLLAWGQGYLGMRDAGREPERLKRQLEPEKLIIFSTGDGMTAPPAATALPPAACKRIEWLSATEAASIRNAISAAPGWEIGQTSRKADPVHWILIPSLSSRSLAERKLAELRQLKVKEGEIVETADLGPFAVSLGFFREQKLAEEFLQSLTRKGVRSAQVERQTLSAEQFALELRAPADALDRRMPELMALLPHASLLDCPKP